MVAPAFLGGQAFAQVDQGIIDATVGRYTLAERGTKKTCTVALTKQGSIGGYSLAVPAACLKVFPMLKDVGVWSFDGKGGLTFRNTLRQTLATFEEHEGGPMTARRPDGVVWTLAMINAPKPLTLAQQMSGKWQINGLGGEPVMCQLIFASKDGKSGTARPLPGCAKIWGGIATWSITGGKLTARSKAGGTIATFRRGDAVTFEQIGIPADDNVYLTKVFD